MQLPHKGTPLGVFIGEAYRQPGRPLYERIVPQAREQGLAGVMGFKAGPHQTHLFRLDTLSGGLSVVVEIMDATEKLDRVLQSSEPHSKAGPVTLGKAQVRFYRYEQ